LTPRLIALAAATVARITRPKKATPLCALCALLCLFAPSSARDNYPRHTELDALAYRIHLSIADASDEISAETEITFALKADGVREIPLDFAGLNIDGVTENGRTATFKNASGRLVIALGGDSRHSGDLINVTIKYHGAPTDGLFFKRNKFGDRTIFADNWPNRAHFWFPSIDHPYDKAKVEFFVNAPARYDVIANGELIETTMQRDGTRLTHWREDIDIPVYCMVVGATEFSILHEGTWNGTRLSYYLYPQDRDRGIHDYGRALRMIEFYSNLVGDFPFEKLALVESSTRFGGMENSSAIFFDEKAYDGSGRLEGTVAHEIAHQWFGDSVTESDWHHLWLSEGFATYFAALFLEHAEGRDKFLRLMRADKDRYMKDTDAVARPIYDPAVTDLFKLLNNNNYAKGGWVLHMLRRVLGDEKFFAGIRDYYRTYRNRNALTEDFRRVMELRAGRPLDWFFREWIYEPGYPIYDAAWHWDESRKQLHLRIRQTQKGAAFRMPLDVEFESGDAAPRRETVEMSEREQSFDFKLERKPQTVALDPDEWVLKVLTMREE
jgi:aminopeptidase N